ncbi:PREDICTED: NADH dehydrogenase [ubiquinone] iron-sulfur protein 6, mitochondrial-like [Branchiostoma belcheri]|uniref:NADH dehydrogenase [ubiquinone] iron-sulfur protein 6, mitochondrial-like n=1 Tax=Branchiostoma belcheri TaxID=7741 RepID=A0A6P5A7V6_BRABE|nr:PREDICTED: NADH dehydrogenase [ubiquinone] iron-sulfur protein 6, mitochondrial-like [Branchiostoma belcheri]
MASLVLRGAVRLSSGARLGLLRPSCAAQDAVSPLRGCNRTLASGATERVTHTGQVYEENDYRKVRFIDAKKEVNPHFAIDLVDEEPPIEVASSIACCDGGGGALGHPKVYINLDQEGPHPCGYCGLRFVKKH